MIFRKHRYWGGDDMIRLLIYQADISDVADNYIEPSHKLLVTGSCENDAWTARRKNKIIRRTKTNFLKNK